MANGSNTFAFFIHPRNVSDLVRTYPILRFFPSRVTEYVAKYIKPIVISKITGLHDADGHTVDGYLIAITMTARQMTINRALAKRKVENALQLAAKLGATYVGLGALTSVVTSGGKDVSNLVEGVHVTNGNALTVSMSFEGLRLAMSRTNITHPTVAVIGATGSIGSALTKLIVQELDVAILHLVGRTLGHLEDLRAHLDPKSTGFVRVTSLEEAVRSADVVITATSSPDALMRPSMLKQNALIYDIAQPQNVSPDVRYERKDVTVIDGALVALPSTVSYHANLGIPQHLSFACLAETMLLACEHYTQDFSLGIVDLQKVKKIAEIAHKHKFQLAPLHSWGELLKE